MRATKVGQHSPLVTRRHPERAKRARCHPERTQIPSERSESKDRHQLASRDLLVRIQPSLRRGFTRSTRTTAGGRGEPLPGSSCSRRLPFVSIHDPKILMVRWRGLSAGLRVLHGLALRG